MVKHCFFRIVSPMNILHVEHLQICLPIKYKNMKKAWNVKAITKCLSLQHRFLSYHDGKIALCKHSLQRPSFSAKILNRRYCTKKKDKAFHCQIYNHHQVSVVLIIEHLHSLLPTGGTQRSSPHLTGFTDGFPEDCRKEQHSGRHSWAESAIHDTSMMNTTSEFHWLNKTLSSSYAKAGSSMLSSRVWQVSYSWCASDGSLATVDINWLQVMLVFLKACSKKMPMRIVQKPLRVPMISPRSILLHSLNRMMEHVTTVVVKHT